MESSTLIAIGSLITVIGGAYVTIKRSNSDVKTATITGEFALSDRLENYIVKLETRLADMDKKKEEADCKLILLRENFESLDRDYLELKAEYGSLKKQLDEVKLENKKLTDDNTLKIDRIKNLEAQVISLQEQLDLYRHIDSAKVEDAKIVLHQTVDDNLNNLKQ